MLSTRTENRASLTRGQTEPLAALVAVGLVCVTLSAYAAFVTGLVPTLESDRELATVTSDRLWDDLDQNGIYPNEGELRQSIDTETLPRGHHVAVVVTYVDETGRVVEADSAGFDEMGEPYSMQAEPEGESYERPIAIKNRDGDIRPGLLTVVVWDDTSGGNK